jgi:hypothetical protein
MTPHDNDLEKFSRLIEALRPWLCQILFIGGRAHRLYRERPEAAPVAYEPLRTDDADVALNPRTLRGSKSIQARLRVPKPRRVSPGSLAFLNLLLDFAVPVRCATTRA